MDNPAEKKAKVSPAYKMSAETKDKLRKIYKPEELLVYTELINRLEKARITRSTPREEFDDMTYEQDYIANRQALNSYLRKKKNYSEVRINTGTTEKKIEVVHNELLQLNLQPTVFAFDQDDNEIAELGDDMSDIIKRTNEIENDQDVWVEALQELLSQRALFLEEQLISKNNPIAKKKVISGLRIYLGDISLPAYRFDEQPYIVKYTRMHWRRAAKLFADNPNWKYVQKGLQNDETLGFDYKFNKNLPEEEVEIVHYMSALDKEYQIICNGVMMLPIGTKLPWNHEGYNIKMIVLKPMSRDFAYGKPLTASAKTLQALDNETIRLLIRKFRQAIEPPLGVRKGKVLTKTIWDPGKVTQGIKEGDFTKLIDHQGVTTSEFDILQLIEEKIKEFVGAGNVMQGLKESGRPTATEIVALQRQAMKMLGLAVYAWVRAKREMSFLRIYNVLENYTKPVKYALDEVENKVMSIYRKFTVLDAKLSGERRGKKVIQFSDRDLNENEKWYIYNKEKEAEALGQPTEYKFINVKKLKSIKTFWYIVVEPKPVDSSELQRMMFTEQLEQAAGIMKLTGRRLNADKVIEEFERRWKIKNIFSQEELQPAGAPENVDKLKGILGKLDEMSGTKTGAELGQGEAAPAKKPSMGIGNLVNQPV